jgi:hypothetical protein
LLINLKQKTLRWFGYIKGMATTLIPRRELELALIQILEYVKKTRMIGRN